MFIALAYPFVKWYFTREVKPEKQKEKQYSCNDCKKVIDMERYYISTVEGKERRLCSACWIKSDDEKYQKEEDKALQDAFIKQWNKAIAKKMVNNLLSEEKAKEIWEATMKRTYDRIIKEHNLPRKKTTKINTSS